ncbi:TPA: hypothetical protein ACXNPR_000291 [Enterobacter cancerogenus]
MLIDDFCACVNAWRFSRANQIALLDAAGNGWETWAQSEIWLYCHNNPKFVVHREKQAYGKSELDTRRVDFVVTEKAPTVWSPYGNGKIEQIFVELKCGGYATFKAIQADITKFEDFYFHSSFSRYAISVTTTSVNYYAA